MKINLISKVFLIFLVIAIIGGVSASTQIDNREMLYDYENGIWVKAAGTPTGARIIDINMMNLTGSLVYANNFTIYQYLIDNSGKEYTLEQLNDTADMSPYIKNETANFTMLIVSGNSTHEFIYPSVTLTYDIGSGAYRWRVGYFQNLSVDNVDIGYSLNVGDNITADYFIGSGAYLSELNISGDITGYALNVSYLYGHDMVGGLDLRGDPWYLSGTDLEIAENLLVDGNITVGDYIFYDGSYYIFSDLNYTPDLSTYLQNNTDINATAYYLEDRSISSWDEVNLSTSPGGNNGEIQFNDNGNFGGSGNLSYTDEILVIGGTTAHDYNDNTSGGIDMIGYHSYNGNPDLQPFLRMRQSNVPTIRYYDIGQAQHQGYAALQFANYDSGTMYYPFFFTVINSKNIMGTGSFVDLNANQKQKLRDFSIVGDYEKQFNMMDTIRRLTLNYESTPGLDSGGYSAGLDVDGFGNLIIHTRQNNPNDMAFRIGNATYSNGKEMMRITNVGVGINTTDPEYPLHVLTNESNISIYSEGAVSASEFITRTSVYDKDKGKALDHINDASFYLNPDNTINHSAFNSYTSHIKNRCVTKVETNYTETFCDTIDKSDCTTYNYPTYNCTQYEQVLVEGVSLGEETALLKQAIYELKIQNDKLEARIAALEKTK